MGRGDSPHFMREGVMANIIIRNSTPMGKTRSEQEVNMRKEWGKTISDEQLDKLRHLERKVKDETGSAKNFISAIDIDMVK